MERYIKLKGYDEWFLVIDKDYGRVPEGLTERMSTKLVRQAIGGSHSYEKGQGLDEISQIKVQAATELNYEWALSKAPYDLLIRESGSYMFLDPKFEVIKDVICTHYPRNKDEYTQVVVCENDGDLTRYWRHFFQRQYPDKTIGVINYFDTRTDADVKAYFETAEYVVFTTTFTSMYWWELLVRNLQPHNKVEGVCANEAGWKEALSIYPKVKNLG